MTGLPIRYFVVTEAAARHHVVVAHEHHPEWLRIVATFPGKDRADSYAEIEEMMLDEHHTARPDEIAPPPRLHEPSSNIRPAFLLSKSETVVRERETTTRSAALQIPAQPVLTTLADEIVAVLPGLLDQFPKGPTVKAIAGHLSVEEHHVRQAVRRLDREKRAVFTRRKDSSAHHLLPVGHTPVPEELTATQRDVMRVLVSGAGQDGSIRISRNDLARRANCPIGTLAAVLYALESKGRLEFLEKGDALSPSTYRVRPVEGDAA